MISCSVVGATGYTGMELIRLLIRHPNVKITHLTTRSDDVMKASALLSDLPKSCDLTIEKKELKQVVQESDVVFLALPHTTAMSAVNEVLSAGKVAVDLSADFRIKDKKVYRQWYGVEHENAALLKKAVYGLPEIFRSEIQEADLIANPGCYPTSVILGIYPLLKRKLIDPMNLIADSKSGVSGAGKKLALSSHFTEVNENFNAYKVNKHQHMPEMAQVLETVAQRKVHLSFVPHLLPISRGIFSTIYLHRKPSVTPKQIVKAFEEVYDGEPFVRFLGDGVSPSLQHVRHTNFCDVGVQVSAGDDLVIVMAAIDNLTKGASGQAVQNMNIRMGLDESAGLI